MTLQDFYTQEEIQELYKLSEALDNAGVETETKVMFLTHLSTGTKRTHMIRFLEENPNVSTAEIEREAIRIVRAEG